MRITHPRPDHGRQKFIGVEFHDGVAEVEHLHPEVEASLLQHGFTIEKDLTSDGSESPFEPLPAADDTEKTSRRRTRGKADALAPANFTVNGAEFVAPADVPLTVADLLLTAEVDDTHELWVSLPGETLDTKISDDWLPIEGASIRTAPRFINGG